MLVFVLAFVLCLLYASDTIIISYCYRLYSNNPSSAKLLLLAETAKLLIASLLHLTDTNSSAFERPEACQGLSQAVLHLSSPRGCSTHTGSHQQHQQQHSRGRSWLPTLLVFSVPSVCYFATNNLSFYALTLLSVPLYTLLCDLKVITTGLLCYGLLDRRLDGQALLSLLGLFCGICLGQYATMRAASGSLAAMAAAASLGGCLLMVAISLVSGAASVYTEWVMNHSRYSHETLNLQNVRLYSIGVVLNAAYFLHSGGRLEGFLSDMRGPHFAVVLVLALMGLITGALIKHFGNITKVYVSTLASLFAAWVSQLLLGQPPPAMFYAGVCVALAASVQLQKRQASVGAADGCPPYSKSSRRPSGGQQQARKLKASLVVPIGLALLVMVFVPQMIPWGLQEDGGSRVFEQQGGVNATAVAAALPHPPANLNNPSSLIPHSLAGGPVPVLPPFAPTCLVAFEERAQLGCQPINCSLSGTCSVDDPACCANLNYRMLEDLSQVLHSKGLAGEAVLVYGSALAAAQQQQSVLASSPGSSVALTPTAVQILAQNATRELLWRRGYVFWEDRGLWRLCPHDQHPAAAFRAAMLSNVTETQQQQQQKVAAVHLEGYLMWSAPEGGGGSPCAAAAAAPDSTAAAAAIMMQPMLAPDNNPAAASGVHSPDSIPQQQQLGGRQGPEERRFCLQQSSTPLVVKAGPGQASIGNLTLPAPHNLEEHLASSYGDNWKDAPNLTHQHSRQQQQQQRQQQQEQEEVPAWRSIQQALLDRLAVTAWGDTPWALRMQQCEAQATGESPEDAGEAAAEEAGAATEGGAEAEQRQGLRGGTAAAAAAAAQTEVLQELAGDFGIR